MRAVIDNCVWISALMARSDTTAPARLLRKIQSGHITAVVSEQSLDELANSLAYPRVQKRIGENGEVFIASLRNYGELAPDIESPMAVTRDPKDDYLVALAAAQGALIISSDKDLLHAGLTPPALTPREFLNLLGNRCERAEHFNQARRMLRSQGLSGPTPRTVDQPSPTPVSAQPRPSLTLLSHRAVGIAPQSGRPRGRTLTSFTRRAA